MTTEVSPEVRAERNRIDDEISRRCLAEHGFRVRGLTGLWRRVCPTCRPVIMIVRDRA